MKFSAKQKCNDDSYVDLISITDFKRKTKLSKKLRKLNYYQEIDQKTPMPNKRKTYLVVGLTGFFVVAAFAIFTNDQIKNDFLHHYEQQYNSFLNKNSNACSKITIQAEAVIQSLQEQLIGQPDAIQDIETVFQSHSTNFTGVVFIGSSGLGKSLATGIIFEKCQLPANSKQYQLMDEYLQKNETWRIINRLNTCGENLIIIDDISVTNTPSVVYIIHKLQRLLQHRILAIFVFNVSKYTASQQLNYSHNVKFLKQKLPGIQSFIEFRTLDQNDLNMVIDRTSQQLEMKLSESQRQEIIDSIDLVQRGMKNVKAKMYLYM